MARIPLSDVKVVNKTTGTIVEYKTANTPNQVKVGNVLFGALNYKGMAVLQKAGIQVVNEYTWRSLIQQLLAKVGVVLTDDMIGARGENWASPSDRALFDVFLNGVAYTPELGKTPVAKQTLVLGDIIPNVVAQPSVVIPSVAQILNQAPISVKADTTDKDKHNVDMCVKHLKAGKDIKDLYTGMMSAKISAEKATEYLKKATDEIRGEVRVTPVVVAQPVVEAVVEKPIVIEEAKAPVEKTILPVDFLSKFNL